MFRPHCARCNHANRPDSKYCTRCGAQLLLRACPSCTLLNDFTAGTCYDCGSELAGHDLALLARAASRESAAPGVAVAEHQNGIKGAARTRVSATDLPREVGAAQTVHGGWAGSSPASFAPSSSSANPSSVSLRGRATPVVVVLAFALIGILGWYGYRAPSADAPPPRAKDAPRGERHTVSGRTNPPQASAAPRSADNEKALRDRDANPACSEAVVALGLCAAAH